MSLIHTNPTRIAIVHLQHETLTLAHDVSQRVWSFPGGEARVKNGRTDALAEAARLMTELYGLESIDARSVLSVQFHRLSEGRMQAIVYVLISNMKGTPDPKPGLELREFSPRDIEAQERKRALDHDVITMYQYALTYVNQEAA